MAVDDASAPPSTGTTPTVVPNRSPRNNIVKTVGEMAAIGKPGESDLISWTITDTAVDQPCTGTYPRPAENGHFVSIFLEVKSSPEFTTDVLPGGFGPQNNWRIVDAEGFTHRNIATVAAAMCHDSDWPDPLAPASKYRFRLTFDSPTPTGILTFVPYDRVSDGGWEWPF